MTSKLRILGISSAKRSPHIPNVPTIAEQGVTGYDVYVAPIGEALPETTPYRVSGANASSTTITNLLNQSVTPSASPSPEPTVTTASARISFRRASVSSPTPTPTVNNPAPIAPAGYQVRIVTIVGSSAIASDTNTTNGFQTNFSVPLSPSQLTLTPAGSDLMISWSAPTADGGSTLIGYDVVVNGTVVCSSTTNLFCNFTPMAAGQNYNVQVFALNSVGRSTPSAASHAVPAPPAAPAAPVTPTPTATATPTPTPTPTATASPKPCTSRNGRCHGVCTNACGRSNT